MSGLGGQTPQHGGRVSLKLTRADEQGALYAATLRAAEQDFSAELQVQAQGGKVTWSSTPEAPAWLLDLAVALARTAWRTSRSEAWPRRITRWRDAP